MIIDNYQYDNEDKFDNQDISAEDVADAFRKSSSHLRDMLDAYDYSVDRDVQSIQHNGVEWRPESVSRGTNPDGVPMMAITYSTGLTAPDGSCTSAECLLNHIDFRRIDLDFLQYVLDEYDDIE